MKALIRDLRDFGQRLSGAKALREELLALQEQVANLARDRVIPPTRAYYYLGDGRALAHLRNGMPIYVYTADRSISPWLISQGIWESFVDDIMMDLCVPGMHVFDVGANQGYYTLQFAGRVGETGRVVALEPNPQMFALLQDSVELNGLRSRVELYNAAAGEQSGELELTFDPLYPGGGNLFDRDPNDSRASSLVKVVKVDDIAGPDSRFDIIKVDVEGWEPYVFRGMEKTLGRSQDATIFTELCWAQWSRAGSPSEILRFIAGERDHVFIIHHDATLERVHLQSPDAFKALGVAYAMITKWDRRLNDKLGHRVRK